MRETSILFESINFLLYELGDDTASFFFEIATIYQQLWRNHPMSNAILFLLGGSEFCLLQAMRHHVATEVDESLAEHIGIDGGQGIASANYCFLLLVIRARRHEGEEQNRPHYQIAR